MPTPAKNPAPPPAGCLWTTEAAHRIGLTVKTLYTYKNQGKAPECFPIARKLAWPIESLDAWLAAQRKQASPDPEQEHDSRPPEPRLTRRKKATPADADDEELQPAA